MQNNNYNMLVDAAGQLMQQHAFDHLPDEKLTCLRESFKKLVDNEITSVQKQKHGNDLLNLCSEADLYTETATQQGLQQWYALMNCFGIENNAGILNEAETD